MPFSCVTSQSPYHDWITWVPTLPRRWLFVLWFFFMMMAKCPVDQMLNKSIRKMGRLRLWARKINWYPECMSISNKMNHCPFQDKWQYKQAGWLLQVVVPYQKCSISVCIDRWETQYQQKYLVILDVMDWIAFPKNSYVEVLSQIWLSSETRVVAY
jgi:hypothetical protein